MKISISLRLIPVAVLIAATCGNRILLLGPSVHFTSHQVELLALGEELVRRGHDVYSSVATFDSGESEAKKMSTPNITRISFRVEKDYSFEKNMDKHMMKSKFSGDTTFIYTSLFRLVDSVTNECEEALADSQFMKKLKELHLDMVVVNRFPLAPCYHIIPHYLNVSYVTIGSAFEPWLGGSPALPSFAYNPLFNYGDKMTFVQRLTNFFFVSIMGTALEYDVSMRNRRHVLETYAPGVSTFKKLIDQSQLFFVTREHVLQWPLPVMPNVIMVPSLGCTPAKALPTDLQQITSSSKHGVIVVSFGSIANYLPHEAVRKMAQAFSQVKEDVIWKVPTSGEKQSELSLSANVHALTWLPQADLMGDKNTRLFITHCGNNGQYEAVFNGIPMVSFPLFGEQDHNAYRAEYRGFGVTLDIVNFTPEQLVAAIRTVIDNSSFSTNVKKASAILRDSPMTPRQTVAYWIEHVLKHGHQHLRSHAMDLAWYEYFMVDVIAFISVVVIVIVFVVLKVCRCCCNCVCKKKNQPKKKKFE